MSDKSSIQIKTGIGYYQNQRKEMLEFIPENAKFILEVGCGEGVFSSMMSREDREIWGIEINPQSAELARKKCKQVFVGDFNEIYGQLPRNYFDCIVFNDVLEHMYAPWDVLRNVKNLLTPQGVVVSSIPNFRYISNLITEILFQGEFRYRPEGGILDDTHIRFFTSKSILRMYQEQGYKVLKHQGINSCKSPKEKLFIRLFLGKLNDIRYKQFATVAKPE
ncbi:MAG TPA: class I SAM-dependent methyltransferase [Paludibacteraceae bacterium]|nr:class I SAM-dependent methyltransferase [Paludibacteraceae bacterium]